MHAVELAARDGQIARHARPDGEHDRVVARAELLGLDVAADVDAETELDPLRAQLLDATLDEALLDLELGHAEANEAARGLVALVHDHCLAGARKLLRAGEARRARLRRPRPGGRSERAAAAARSIPRPRRGRRSHARSA